MTTYEDVLKAIALENDALMVLTSESRSAIRGLPALLGKRFIDVGIAEQTMIGVAAGLALRGRVPVVHALSTFLVMRAFEFIRTDIGLPGLPVKLVGSLPGFLSEANGPTHQSLEDISLMRGIPGMQVFCPADASELAEAIRPIFESGKPAYVRYNPQKPAEDRRPAPFEIGRAEVFDGGAQPDITIATYGFLLREVLKARRALEANGHSVRVLNMRSLKPVDVEAVLAAAKQTRVAFVVVEDHFLTGGLCSILAEIFLENGVAPKRFLPIALDGRWFKPALLDEVLEFEGFTGARIAARILHEIFPSAGPALWA